MSQPNAAIARPAAQAKNWRRGFTSDRISAILVICPSLILIGVFVYSFLAQTAYISMSAWMDLAPDYTFVGLHNYERLFTKARFIMDLRNTAIFTIAFVVVCLLVGLLLAALLDSRVKGEAIFRSIFMFPLAISFIVTGVAWRWLESPNAGLNLLFGTVPFGWFTDPAIGILGVALAAVWQTSGYVMAMYLAGLRGVSDDLREAARMDGASELQVFRFVLLPLLAPITLSAIIVLGNISLKIFDLVITMSGSQPGFITDVPALNMFETTFLGSHFAEGAAIAMVILLLVSVLIVPYLIWTARTEANS
jgi:glucose/mannose transport system permease protein